MRIGRRSFTRTEIEQLRRLTREKQTADALRQKTLRARMRQIGFYISDFAADPGGFVVSDLDDLVRRGVIEVVETGESVPDEVARAATTESREREETLGPGEVAKALAADPVSVTAARAQPLAGGAPAAPGFYAWWATKKAIAGCPHHPHPARAELGLLYVGISPARESSAGTIRSRVVGQHVGGNTSSSTFRFVLAALLLEELALTPRKTGSKVVLDAEDNARLRAWQLEHLSLTWCERERPWEVESEVIERMQPPLNSAGNRDHPFHARVTSARAAFRAAARL